MDLISEQEKGNIGANRALYSDTNWMMHLALSVLTGVSFYANLIFTCLMLFESILSTESNIIIIISSVLPFIYAIIVFIYLIKRKQDGFLI
jgi:hypothetical protein